MTKVYWTLDDIQERSRQLGICIRDSGLRPDLVVGIRFGGDIVGRRVAEVVQAPYAAISIKRRLSRMIGRNPRVFRWFQPVIARFEDTYYRHSEPFLDEPLPFPLRQDQVVLIVDDDIVLSKTTRLAQTHIVDRGADPARVHVAALAVHPELPDKPRYYLETVDAVFPWSVTSPYYEEFQKQSVQAKTALR